MSNVYFYYGVMNSGKTMDALRAAHQYEERGLKPLCLMPKLDTRSGEFWRDDYDFLKGVWSSRVGLQREVFVIETGVKDIAHKIKNETNFSFDVIIIDEVQFLTKEQVEELFELAHIDGIPVICYGLLTTFKTTLFEGSKRLIELGAKLKEIKGISSNGKKAVINAKIVNGKIATEGEIIEIGDTQYVPLSLVEYWRKLREQEDGKDEI